MTNAAGELCCRRTARFFVGVFEMGPLSIAPSSEAGNVLVEYAITLTILLASLGVFWGVLASAIDSGYQGRAKRLDISDNRPLIETIP